MKLLLSQVFAFSNLYILLDYKTVKAKGVNFSFVSCVFCKQLLLVLSFHLLLDVILVVCGRLWNLASRGARQAWGLCTKAHHAVMSLSSPARLGQ